MITSKQRSLIGLAALFAIASTQACGSDAVDPTPSAGAPGAAGAPPAGAPGTAGTPSSSAGAPSAGAPSAGAPSAGASSAGAPAGGAPGAAGAPATGAGSGGASAGSGSSSAGSAGKSGGSGGSAGGSAGAAGGGSSTATFAAVKTIMSASCGTGMCHDGMFHTNFQKGDLYATLTTPIPTTGPAQQGCMGTTLVTAGDVNSFLVKVISAKATCKHKGTDMMVDRMPDKCGSGGSNPKCLTATEIKTITDWVAGGAPK